VQGVQAFPTRSEKMSGTNQTAILLNRVARRLRFAAFAERLYVAFLICCSIYAAALLASRFFGVAVDWFPPASLAIPPGAAVLIALVWHRMPTTQDAARRLDAFARTKDLFLTASLLENSAGDFQPLVMTSAENRAGKIQPALVVPFRFVKQVCQVAAAGCVLAVGLLFLPQFDPFGKVEASQAGTKIRQSLDETKKATQVRAAQLQKDESEGEVSEETKKAVESLKLALNKMKPSEKSSNLKVLAGEQKHLGDMWRKISAEKLKELLNQQMQGQHFGGSTAPEKLEKWARELQEGSTKSLQQEISELKAELQQLAKTDDPVKKAELEQKIKKRLKDIEEFARTKVNSKPLTAALERARKQLEMAKMPGMQSEAAQAASESAELARMELQEIAQSAKDLKELEEALKVLQMAKRLADKEKLDGEMSEGLDGLEAYGELYAELMAQLGLDGEGDGEGMGGRGIGEGGVAPEDDSVATGFKTEQSKSAVTAGKVLLSVKTKGMSDRGDAKKEYREAIQKVQQGVSEAILQEQIPPGYHEGIKSYFDNLDKSNGGTK
jgi:hypothetical protein